MLISLSKAATLVSVYVVYVVVVVCAPKIRRIFRVHYLGQEHKESKSFIQQAREREGTAVVLEMIVFGLSTIKYIYILVNLTYIFTVS